MSAVVIDGGERPGPPTSGPDDLVLRTVGGYVTLADAAQFFGLNHWRLRKAVTRGELPALKSGPGQTAPYFVRVVDVTRYLAEGYRRRQGRRAKRLAARGLGSVAAAPPVEPGAPPIGSTRVSPQEPAPRVSRADPD